MTQHDALADYFPMYRRKVGFGNGTSPRSIEAIEVALRRLTAFIHSKEGKGFSTDPRTWNEDLFFAFDEYLRTAPKRNSNQPLAENSRISYLRSLHVFCSWVMTKCELGKHPFGEARVPKAQHQERPVLSTHEFSKLVEAATIGSHPQRDIAILYCLLDGALRINELRMLRVDDIRWDSSRLYICKTKGKVDRKQPVSSMTLEKLSAYEDVRSSASEFFFVNEQGEQFASRYALYEVLRRLSRRSGVKANPHKFRHTFATILAQRNVNAFHLQELMGHRSLDVTRRYVHLNQTLLQEQHERYGPFSS